MPILYLRRLTGKERSRTANRHLGLSLAFVAGATNAGGFLVLHRYTSHMTGIVSSMADQLAMGEAGLALAGFGALISFIAGAACSAMLINWARRHYLQSEYALSLMLEALLLLCFGLLGGYLSVLMGFFVPMTVMLLCFNMGLQNAIITKLSNAEIRTTHVTGLVTDIGIELGRMLYWNDPKRGGERVHANRNKLRLVSGLLTMFFFGGIVGAWGFRHVGFLSTVPLALGLLVLAVVPVIDDLRAKLTKHKVGGS